MLTKHFWVEGRVQGVYFRASAQALAQQLGLTGWVGNIADGRVEIVATGTEVVLEEFERWLWRGPKAAKVDSVKVVSEPLVPFEGFVVDK